jgi:predicted O-methyltransferase YrrM
MKTVKILLVGLTAIVLVVALIGVGNLIAQERTNRPDAPAAEQPSAGGQPPQGPQRFENLLDQLTKAYEQNDREKMGQLIEELKQSRQRFQRGAGGPEGRFGRGMGQGPPMPGEGGGTSTENPPLAKTETEKKILSVLDDMDRNQRGGMMNVPREDGRLLRLLTETNGAKNVVEIGTSNGYSGIWLCLALQTTGGKLTTHEIDANRAALARENFKKAGVDKLVTLVEGDAHEMVKNLKDPIDVLFIDADKEGYFDYLNKLLPLVRPGGLVLGHNVNRRGEMQDFIKVITTNPDLETAFQGQGQDLSVTLKKRQVK